MTYATRARARQTSTNKYRCTICDKRFSTEGWLSYHLKKLHPGISVEVYAAHARNGRNRDRFFTEMGFHRCPHLGLFCPGPNNAGPAKCRGKEDCIRIQFQPWIAGLFEESEGRSRNG